MLSGSSRRLTIAALLLAVLVVAPAVTARPPVPARDAAETTGGQEISDAGLDPTGRFATVVVRYDGTRSLNPGGLLGGATGSSTGKDVYRCDLGPVTAQRGGEGCRGVNHASASGGTNPNQAVDVTSHPTTGGLLPVFAVAGPSDAVSFWHYSSDQARWTKTLGDPVVNVSVSPDGARVAAATKAAGKASKLFLYDAAGKLLWDVELTDAGGAAVDAGALAFSRDGRLLAVGSGKGLFFLDPYGAKPTRLRDVFTETDSAVRSIALSRAGDALVAGTATSIYYIPLSGGKPGSTLWNRGVPEGVTAVTLSLDGQRFAAAAGNRILFYRHIGGSFIAEQLPAAFDAGAAVADLAYDATGSLLVAVAGESVHAFGPHTTTPLWSFRATEVSRGGLDGPLRKVALSDGGERLLVAGRTKFLAYTNVLSASVAFGVASPVTVIPGRPLTLPYAITNTGSLADNYTFVVRAPVGWTASGPGDVELAPDSSAPLNLTVEAPSGTAPGVHALTLDVRSRATSSLLTTAQINLSVPRSVALSLETPEEKVTLRQGAERALPLTIRNTGNAEGVVNLTVSQVLSQGSSWAVRFETEQVRVPAGGETDVDLVVSAPADATSGTRNVLTVRAREGDVEASKVLTAYVDPDFGSDLSAANTSLDFRPGESRTLQLTLRNVGNTEDTFNVTQSLTPALAANDWKVTLAEDLKVTLAPGASRTLSVAIRPGVAEPRDATVTFRAVSQGSPAGEESTVVVLLRGLPPEDPTDDPEDNLLPGPSLVVLLAAAGLALLVLRRGGKR